MGAIPTLLLMLVILCVVMIAAWWMQKKLRNAGWVDVFWTLGTGATGVVAALLQGITPRTLLVAVLAAIWALRLGLYILVRTRFVPHEDARYARFRQEWGARYEARMFGMVIIQAFAAWPLTIAIFLAARNPSPLTLLSTIAGIGIAVAALAGETIADRQMGRVFAARPATRERFVMLGSGHGAGIRTTSFEWLYWLAYPALALAGFWPWGIFALGAPLIMYILLTKISGVPMLEREMLASRKDAYKAYQDRVPAFFPRPPG